MYYNSNIIIKAEYTKGTVKDLKEYYRYDIASQCTTGEYMNFENLKHNIKNNIDLLEDLITNYKDSDIVRVYYNEMGAYYTVKEV